MQSAGCSAEACSEPTATGRYSELQQLACAAHPHGAAPALSCTDYSVIWQTQVGLCLTGGAVLCRDTARPTNQIFTAIATIFTSTTQHFHPTSEAAWQQRCSPATPPQRCSASAVLNRHARRRSPPLHSSLHLGYSSDKGLRRPARCTASRSCRVRPNISMHRFLLRLTAPRRFTGAWKPMFPKCAGAFYRMYRQACESCANSRLPVLGRNRP